MRHLVTSTLLAAVTSMQSSAQGDTSGASADDLLARAANYSVRSEPIPRKLLWGDTHLHTKFSFDAGMIGNRLGPDEAYQFARGDTVTARWVFQRDYVNLSTSWQCLIMLNR